MLKLFSGIIDSSPATIPNRIQIEDNIGEAIHLHYRNIRWDFSIRDFQKLGEGCINALIKILEQANLNGRLLDRKFVGEIAKYTSKIIDFQEKKTPLSKLYAIEYV